MDRLAYIVLLLGVLLAMLLPTSAWGQDMAVPVPVQQKLLMRILAYERTLQADASSDELVIGIAYQERFRSSLRAHDEFMEEARAGLSVGDRPVRLVSLPIDSPEQLARVLDADPVDALYLAPLRAVRIEAIAALSSERGIVTLTGVPEYAEAGIAVAIGVGEGRRPEIIINLDAAEAQGRQFSARLLKLARVIAD